VDKGWKLMGYQSSAQGNLKLLGILLRCQEPDIQVHYQVPGILLHYQELFHKADLRFEES
jgi:hypothetical protein